MIFAKKNKFVIAPHSPGCKADAAAGMSAQAVMRFLLLFTCVTLVCGRALVSDGLVVSSRICC